MDRTVPVSVYAATVGTLVLALAASHATAGDPVDDLLRALSDPTRLASPDGAADLSFDSIVSGELWESDLPARRFNSDLHDGDAPQPIGMRGVLSVGAWEFTFAPTWWVNPPWSVVDADSAVGATADDSSLLTLVDIERWRVNGGIGWHLTNAVEVQTEYSYTKDANSNLEGDHTIDLRVTFSF